MRAFWIDLHHAARILRQNPTFALVAVLVLALGIGATTAMFTVVDAAMLRPLPYPEPDRLMWVSVTFPRFRAEWMLGPDYAEWKQQNHVFESFTAFDSDTCDLSGGEEPVRLQCGTVTQDFFSTLGVQPVLGRAFLPAEDQPLGPKAVILTHGIWQRQFGADHKVLGRTVTLDGESHTVVGVMPPGFHFPGGWKVDALVPMQLDLASELQRNAMLILHTAGRLKRGVAPAQAHADLELLMENNRRRFPQYYQKDNQVRVVSLAEHETGGARLTLLVLLAAVGCVLLIAMVNIANLLLARAAGRRREIAVRMALGAGRWRLARQLLTESLLLGLLGGIAGLLTASAALKVMVPIAPDWIPHVGEPALDFLVLEFAIALSLITGLLFGSAPAFFAGRCSLNEALKHGGSRAAGTSGGRLRGALVVVELAFSLVLLTGASLLLESLWQLETVPLGFQPERVLTARIARHLAAGQHTRLAFWEELMEKIRRLPGVEAVALASGLPPEARSMDAPFSREGHPEAETHRPGDTVVGRFVSPGYFRAMGIPLRQGRLFNEHDALGVPETCIVNEALVRRFFTGEIPLGQRILGHKEQNWKTIVGVVADARNAGLRRNPLPEMYQSYRQVDDIHLKTMDLLVRSPVQSRALTPLLRDTIRRLDPNLPLTFHNMEDNLADLAVQPRFSALLLTIFAGAALLLAAVGTYGVLSYSVTLRTQEIGIRMALGATPSSVIRIVVSHALRLAATGIAIGLALAFALTRYLGSLLFEVHPTDPLTFAGVCVLLTATALLASWIPGRRATHVDPVRALRCD